MGSDNTTHDIITYILKYISRCVYLKNVHKGLKNLTGFGTVTLLSKKMALRSHLWLPNTSFDSIRVWKWKLVDVQRYNR